MLFIKLSSNNGSIIKPIIKSITEWHLNTFEISDWLRSAGLKRSIDRAGGNSSTICLKKKNGYIIERLFNTQVSFTKMFLDACPDRTKNNIGQSSSVFVSI